FRRDLRLRHLLRRGRGGAVHDGGRAADASGPDVFRHPRPDQPDDHGGGDAALGTFDHPVRASGAVDPAACKAASIDLILHGGRGGLPQTAFAVSSFATNMSAKRAAKLRATAERLRSGPT